MANGNGGAGATQAGAAKQMPSVPLREHLATMFPHVVADYQVTPFTEPAHEVGGATLDNVVTNVLLRHAQRTMGEASIQAEDFAAFVMDKGYVAHTVDFISGPLYGENVHFGGFQRKGDMEPVLASQATLMGYLNSVPGHDEPATQKAERPSRLSATLIPLAYMGGAGVVGGILTADIAASHGSPTPPFIVGAAAALIAGVGTLVGYFTGARTMGPAGATSVSGSGVVAEESFYTAEIADAARAHYTNLRNLRDMLDFKVTVTDTEMMDKLMRPFSDLEQGVREELHYLKPDKREEEVQKRRKNHLDAQASLSDALCLYIAVDNQLSALEPLVRYKGLLPPPMPAPQAAAGSAGPSPA